MRVLMFGWEFPPHISGGLGTACFGLTRGLVTHGVDVSFVVPKVKGSAGGCHVSLMDAGAVPPPDALQAEETLAGWKRRLTWLEVDSPLTPYLTGRAYQRWRAEVHGPSRAAAGGASPADRLPAFTGEYGRDLLGEVLRYGMVGESLGASHPCDLIHAHDWMAALAGAGAKRVSGRPMVFHVHATEFDRTGGAGDPRIAGLERHGMESADRIVAVSHRTKHLIVERYGIPERKIEVVHNAVEKSADFSRGEVPFRFRDKLVLFLGRVTSQKGPEYFIDAARIVLARWRADRAGFAADGVPGVRFVMAGSGDLLPGMIQRAAAFGMTDRFHFTGFLRGADVDRMFATCDLYVLPSVSEPFGITPLEAMKHDVPVILSKQSGVAEILPHARKVDFWDVRKLAAEIEAILRSPAATCHQLEENRKVLDGMDWNDAAGSLCRIYRHLLAA